MENRNAELEKMIKEKTAELQKSLEELKANQAQLIQSEKLASLGQLAAGIAHEIKNPMNFVNNFAELSLEYMSEIQDEIGNLEQNKTTADIGNLLKDVEDNLKKYTNTAPVPMGSSNPCSCTRAEAAESWNLPTLMNLSRNM